MTSRLEKLGSLGKTQIVHIIVGGLLCLGATFLLVDVVQNFLLQILASLGIAGVMVYAQEFDIASAAFIFGLAYVIGGFLGGLYTGYQIYENLRVVLLIPALIGTFGFTLILVVFANYSLDLDFITLILLQLLGNATGSYLGGYALNWAQGDTEAAGKFSIKLGG